jgi:hypothetical protein
MVTVFEDFFLKKIEKRSGTPWVRRHAPALPNLLIPARQGEYDKSVQEGGGVASPLWGVGR